jgi:RND family efflux transporter MFP subunit
MSPRRKNTLLKILLPIVVLAVAGLAAWAMIASRPEPEVRAPEVPVPLVRAVEVELSDRVLTVESQGTVSPRTESVLVPEVAGRVIEVSPSFVSGGFFEAGEVLLRIDPHDYREALVQARAAVAQAELRVAMEQAEADVARREWEDLGEQGEAPPLTARVPQLAEAEAALAAARSAVSSAERNLDRTEIRAPFDGRVRQKQVDVGQYVAPGTPIGTVYAVDYAEIRLPLPNADLAFVDLPLVFRGDAADARGPEVVLRADFAGRTHEWRGRIVRTEGEIDPRTRMVHAVARVKDPYGHGDDPGRPPLAVGLFVQAEITGQTAKDVAILPRSALRDDGTVLVVDEEDRLRIRPVEVLRAARGEVVISSGLANGERVCLTSLAAVSDGMRVRVAEEPSDA